MYDLLLKISLIKANGLKANYYGERRNWKA